MQKNVKKWGANRSWNPDHKKVQLADVVPLETPFLVYIDPANVCNFKCRFCPTGHPDLLKKVGRPAKVMEFALFEKIIDDLAKFPSKIRALFFHKDGEALMNPRFGEMMSLAVQKQVAEKYWLTTNASLLTPAWAEKIVASGITAVRLSIEHVTSEGYRNITQTFSDYEGLLRGVAALYEERERRGSKMSIVAKMINFDFTQEELDKFAKDFGNITDELLLTEPNAWSYNEAYDFTLGVKPKAGYDGEMPLAPDRIACINPFYNLAINANGLVGPCPLDWSLATIIGDVRSESLYDIWNGKKSLEFQRLHLAGKRNDNQACRKCECIPYAPESELDPFLDRLLPKYDEILRTLS
jgi:radical SAM protein with 4Fe4S-binding SPASM domain